MEIGRVVGVFSEVKGCRVAESAGVHLVGVCFDVIGTGGMVGDAEISCAERVILRIRWIDVILVV